MIMGMKPLKAPGLDSFQPFFYKQFWPIVSKDLQYLVKKAFRNSLLDTLLVLIPKVDNLSYLNDFRPISLCNIAYKVITKILVAHIRPFLVNIVGPFQGRFIPRRGTTDNVL
uniref:Transposon TX1 uncharacterized n=1 Tax=Cajanus cajan TaxID=3821 RepID=A0A151T0R8_CAJCA|nr:Transposon TX1 uncharacterized [Cajanus cajan]